MKKLPFQSRTDFLQLMLKAQKGENIKDQEDEEDENTAQENQTGHTNIELYFIPSIIQQKLTFVISFMIWLQIGTRSNTISAFSPMYHA